MQSYYLLEDDQVIKAGYILDTLISVRAFNYYRLFPWFFKGIQVLNKISSQFPLQALLHSKEAMNN